MRLSVALFLVGVCASCSPHPLDGGGAAGTGGTAGAAGTTGTAGTTGAAGSSGMAGAPGIAGTTGTSGEGGAGGGGPKDGYELTEWTVPFSGSAPFQIAARNGDVFYLTKDYEQSLGRLDVATGTFTEWPTPYVGTSPGGIEVRPSDGAVFMTGATLGEVGQFDPGAGTLARWKLPTDNASSPGPWSLAFDGATGVFFTMNDTTTAFVGRLDTATGDLRLWTFSSALVARVVVAPDGAVLFSCWNSSISTVSNQIARLDPATGVFTSWPLTSQPLYPATVGPDGDIFFQGGSNDFRGVARLAPSTGRLTEWTTTAHLTDSLTFLAGRLYFAMYAGTGGLHALDPSAPGSDRTIAAVSETVAPRTFQLSPTRSPVPLGARRATVIPVRSRVPSETSGPFESWQAHSARMLAATPGAVYFTEDSAGAIGRLTR